VSAQPGHNYNNKSVQEIMLLTGNKDASIRSAAAMFLGLKYKDPKMVRPNEPFLDANSQSPELTLLGAVIQKLNRLLETDESVDVRIAALSSLELLRCRTNTTSIILKNLTNNLTLIRLRASEALISISKQYNERLPDQVIPTLISCLNPKEDPDEIWQAALVVGNIGKSAKAAIPVLEKLKTHPSKKVREYAAEALEHISAPSN
jgi:HEAT repeat protein